METFSALLALCEGNSLVTGEFPSHWPVTQSFGDFFDLRLNKRLSKPSRRRWFETPSRSLWRSCNIGKGEYSRNFIQCVMWVNVYTGNASSGYCWCQLMVRRDATECTGCVITSRCAVNCTVCNTEYSLELVSITLGYSYLLWILTNNDISMPRNEIKASTYLNEVITFKINAPSVLS